MRLLRSIVSAASICVAFSFVPANQRRYESPGLLQHKKNYRQLPPIRISPFNNNNNNKSRLAASVRFLPDAKDRKALVSISAFVTIDVAFRKLFAALEIAFPSSLGACAFLLTFLLTFKANKVYEFLEPGAKLLSKWLPVFFVPSLVTLPLANGVGSSLELAKIGAVIVGGFAVSLLTTAYAVLLVRDKPIVDSLKNAVNDDKVNDAAQKTKKSTKAFSDELFQILLFTTFGTGLLAASSSIATSVFLVAATLASFVLGARLPITKIVHPLVTCTGVTWAITSLFGKATKNTFNSMLQTYSQSAGKVLLFGLGPAVVSLAISMYEKRKLIRENWAAILTSIVVSTASGLFGTAMAVRSIASPSLRLSLLSRNITSPLAMAIARMLGADVSLAVSMVVVTGLIGANFGASILSAFGIKDAVARGLSVGSAAHGLGTAAMTSEQEAFPFAAIAMALTATAATVTVSIPVLRRILIQLALGA